MAKIDTSIEDLIPHRSRMKLIDEIIDVDENNAVTGAVVTDQWPLFCDNAVNPLVLIELVAQTAGVYVGWREFQKKTPHGKGWLVGIKKAVFSGDMIPLNTKIITSIRCDVNFDNYLELSGIVSILSIPAAEIIIQIIWAED